MKKAIAILLLVCFAALALAGCGDKYPDSPYLGTWEGATAEYLGMEFNVPDLMGGEFNVTLEASGKATVDYAGESATGKWEPTEGGILLQNKFGGDDEMFFEDAGDGVLLLDYEGISIYFVK